MNTSTPPRHLTTTSPDTRVNNLTRYNTYAEAIDYLAKRGIVEIDHQAGRRVTARWVQR